MEPEEVPAKPPIESQSALNTRSPPEDRANLKRNGFYYIRSKRPATATDAPVAKKPRHSLPLLVDPPKGVESALEAIRQAQNSGRGRPSYRYINHKADPTASGSNSEQKKKKTYSCRYVTAPAAVVKKETPSDENEPDLVPFSYSSNEFLRAMIDLPAQREPPKMPYVFSSSSARAVENKNSTPFSAPFKKTTVPQPLPKPKPDLLPSSSHSPNENSTPFPTLPEKSSALPPNLIRRLDLLPSSSYSPNEIVRAMFNFPSLKDPLRTGVIPPSPSAPDVDIKNSTLFSAPPEKKSVLPPLLKQEPELLPRSSTFPKEILKSMAADVPPSKLPSKIPIVPLPSSARVMVFKKPYRFSVPTKIPPYLKEKLDREPYESFSPREFLRSVARQNASHLMNPSKKPIVPSSETAESKNSTLFSAPPKKTTVPQPLPRPKPSLLPSPSNSPNVIMKTMVDYSTPNELSKILEKEIKGKQMHETTSADHILCGICERSIASSRKTNIWSHVRRHCALKRFQCNVCSYTVNEKNRMIRHMTNNHDENSFSDFNDSGDQLKLAWTALMNKCFPGVLDKKGSKGADSVVLAVLKEAEKTVESGILKESGGKRGLDLKKYQLESLHTCVRCGEAVIVEGKDLEPLICHLTSKHQEICVFTNVATSHMTFGCDQDLKREEDFSAEAKNFEKLVPKFFPSIENVFGKREDPEESTFKIDPEEENVKNG